MDRIRIRGGRPLSGEIVIGGAKNAALPLMAAAILTRGKVVLHRVPRLADIETMIKVLAKLRVAAEWSGANTLEIQVEDEANAIAPYDLVRQMRASICVLGPLLARRGWARVALPGCPGDGSGRCLRSDGGHDRRQREGVAPRRTWRLRRRLSAPGASC